MSWRQALSPTPRWVDNMAGVLVTGGAGYIGSHVTRLLADRPLNITQAPRRAGDPATLVAKADLIRQTLNWQPQYNDIEGIVASALQWERHLAGQSGS